MGTERGAILLIVLIVLLTISLLGATLVALFYNVFTTSETELNRAKALYLAEAGVAKAISILKGKPDVQKELPDKQVYLQRSSAQKEAAIIKSQGRQIIPATGLGEGSFEVYSDVSQTTIVSIGECNGVRRTVQVKYNAF